MATDEGYWYWAPFIQCKNQRANPRCNPILLPHPSLPEGDEFFEEDTYSLNWPSAEWKAIFGCTQCGHLHEYSAEDVQWNTVSKSSPGTYHSGAHCFSVEFRCGQLNCKAPVRLLVEKTDADESEIGELLRSGFFVGSLPCGHSILPIPAGGYKILRVMEFT